MTKSYLKDNEQNIMEDVPRVEEFAATYFYTANMENDTHFISILKKLIGLNFSTLARWLNITPRTFKNYLDKKTSS